MVKFILGIVIVCFTSFCGYVLARRYRERKEFFSQLYEFNERFLNEIAYYRRPLAEFARIYTYKGEFQQTLNGFFISMKEGRERACTVNEAIVLPDFLAEEENVLLRDYFSMLGRGDSNSQKAYFSSVKSALSDHKKKSAADCQRYGDLYLKLGFLLGLAILVLIV